MGAHMKKQAKRYTIHQGDALSILHTLPSASVDAVITDPPYCSGSQAETASLIAHRHWNSLFFLLNY